MEYIILFLSGIIAFVSPCLLPMIPVYISYFAGQTEERPQNAIFNALGFVLGFSIVFVLLGVFAGGIGGFLQEHQIAVNLISGVIVIIFGLSFMGLLRLPGLTQNRGFQLKKVNTGFFSSLLFGTVFSVGWTPCTGAFLGSALMLAAQSGSRIQGMLLLICYSLGLGIPFLLTTILLDRLKQAFDFIRRNYTVINRFSGGFLILTGIFMATGWMGKILSFLSF